jgi:hypothetical protein
MNRLEGLTFERALFPLLVLVRKYGPTGLADVAIWVGGDYTPVIRQGRGLNSLAWSPGTPCQPVVVPGKRS